MILVLFAIVAVAGFVAYRRLAHQLHQVEMRLRTAELRLERREASANAIASAAAAEPAAEARGQEAPAPAAALGPEAIAAPEPAAEAASAAAATPASEASAAPAPEPVTAAADAAQQAPPPRPRAPAPAAAAARSFEETVGTRWMVWVGGVALALGGIFLVRYSIERGWLGPGARTILGFLLAAMLIGAGELARRRELKATVPGLPVADIPGVLTAAGIVTGFASAYVAHAVYGFLGPAAAFLLLGAFSLSAFAAAVLHGPILAAFGIAGSYLTPFLTARRSRTRPPSSPIWPPSPPPPSRWRGRAAGCGWCGPRPPAVSAGAFSGLARVGSPTTRWC